jgi:hypothetical protein
VLTRVTVVESSDTSDTGAGGLVAGCEREQTRQSPKHLGQSHLGDEIGWRLTGHRHSSRQCERSRSEDGVLADLLVVECQNGKYSLALSTDLSGSDCCRTRN